MIIFRLSCADNLNTVLENWDLRSLPLLHPKLYKRVLIVFGI